MPVARNQNAYKPFYEALGGDVRLYLGDVRAVLQTLPSQSVHCCVTSPPYWGLRDYGVGGQIGSEPSPDCGTFGQAQCGCFVCTMVAVFREVHRVLRDDGTVFLNLGDSYSAGKRGGKQKTEQEHLRNVVRAEDKGYTVGGWGKSSDEGQGIAGRNSIGCDIPTGNLVGIPWRVALALQADGWILRQDIIWCLSGGTWVYVRSQKGDMPMMVRDLARLDPASVKLWNGEKWTQLLGMSCNGRKGDELELVLRSGERISCTPTHKWPTSRGLVEAGKLRVGDCLQQTVLPQPDNPKRPQHITEDAAWFAGLYLAEGCGMSDDKIQIAGHAMEVERWEKVQKIVNDYGGYCTLSVKGNNQTIRVYGKVICAIVRELVSGHDAKNKGIATVVWRYRNNFLEAYMGGYLSGDGSDDLDANNRWALGFTRNYNLERDLRTACARLGWQLTLNPRMSTCNGVEFPSFRGEIRKAASLHGNAKDRCEILEIRKARCREVWDLGVADEPHTYALASGLLTHNSKPSPMPESVSDRCTKAHEYIFLLARQKPYYYDSVAISEKSTYGGDVKILGEESLSKGQATASGILASGNGKAATVTVTDTRNKRSVWTVTSQGYEGSHFACFPQKLIEPCILAGVPEFVCAECGAPRTRIVEKKQLTRERPNEFVKRVPTSTLTGGNYEPPGRRESKGQQGGAVNTCSNSVAGVDVKTTGWQPTCTCNAGETSGTVLDPFVGSATTCVVALQHGRKSIGIDLSEKYLLNNAIPRIEGYCHDTPALAARIAKPRKALVGQTLIK